MTESDYTWGRVSGAGARDCHMLAYGSPAGEPFDPATGESWVTQGKAGTLTTHLEKAGWYTDLWRSEAGLVYVTDAGGFIQQTSAPDATTWSTHTVPGVLVGVWGLSDEHVFAWGLRGKSDFMVRWDGKAWADMPAPQGGIVAIHGTRPDLLFAVGDGGLIARWDGVRWTDMSAPSDEPLRSVFVAADDEVWACGNRVHQAQPPVPQARVAGRLLALLQHGRGGRHDRRGGLQWLRSGRSEGDVGLGRTSLSVRSRTRRLHSFSGRPSRMAGCDGVVDAPGLGALVGERSPTTPRGDRPPPQRR